MKRATGTPRGSTATAAPSCLYPSAAEVSPSSPSSTSRRFRWSVQDLEEPSENEDVGPYIDQNVALYVLGRHLYAYSALAGRWDTLSLEERLVPRPGYGPEAQAYFPSVKHDSIAVSQHGRLHIFTAKAGRWQTIDPKE